jgi:hypothetical protein
MRLDDPIMGVVYTMAALMVIVYLFSKWVNSHQ